MKKTIKLFIPLTVNIRDRFCLWVWIFGIFGHHCTSAEFDIPSQDRCAYPVTSETMRDSIVPTQPEPLQNQEITSCCCQWLPTLRWRLPCFSPREIEPLIPPLAQGYEEIYLRFLRGKLVYRPFYGDGDTEKIELRIKDLANPLEGTFDLSRCGDTGKRLHISTGYKKRDIPENAFKFEIWIAPRFLIERELSTTAKHFQPIMDNWKQEAPVGLFWTWGGGALSAYEYRTTQTMDEISKDNLYDQWHPFNRPWRATDSADSFQLARCLDYPSLIRLRLEFRL